MTAQMRAHDRLLTAIKRGHIARGDVCEKCGGSRHVHAHHDDYMLPLEVRWLCASCHVKWHYDNGPGIGADLSRLAAMVAEHGIRSEYPSSFVRALKASIVETGGFIGRDGEIVPASEQLKISLGMVPGMVRPKREIRVNGEELTKARIAAGFSLEDVAKVLDVDRSTVSRWEQNKVTPPEKSIIKMMILYKADYRVIAGGERE